MSLLPSSITFESLAYKIWFFQVKYCHNPTLRECEDEIHTPEMGTWESFGTPEILEFDRRGQNTS
jgi:hypothetical protein